MTSGKYFFTLPLLLVLFSCGTDYPPIDQYTSFNIGRSVTFSIPSAADTGIDTTLIATGSTDTSQYDKNGTTTALLRTSEVWRVALQSSDPNFTLDQLGTIHLLIGSDTVAFDTMPMGTLDTNLILTKTDITKPMSDTSFTASLECQLSSHPENPVTISCAITVIYTATYLLQ